MATVARRPPPLWAVVSAAWLVPAILAIFRGFLEHRLGQRDGYSWQSAVWEGGDWFLYAFLTPVVLWMGSRYPLTPGALARRVPLHVGASLLMCVAWAGGGILLSLALFGSTPYGGPAVGWLLTTLPFGVAVYFAILGVQHAVMYFLQAREREHQLTEARLGALRMQMQPHFLFNSLNAITVILRDQDSATATRMLERLSDMLRRVMRADRPQEVTLAEELDFVRQYLAIEEVRFPDRLRPVIDVAPGLETAAVPEFILQPLVENAVRHGLARRIEATLLSITARREADRLVLTVTDDGPGPGAGPEERAGGVGLANVRERLRTLYGDRGDLTLSATAAGGAVARVRLPYRDLTGGPGAAGG
jgi:signal transduction histidine kinase